MSRFSIISECEQHASQHFNMCFSLIFKTGLQLWGVSGQLLLSSFHRGEGWYLREGWFVGGRQSRARHWAFHSEYLFADHAWSHGVENGERVVCRMEPPEQAPLGSPCCRPDIPCGCGQDPGILGFLATTNMQHPYPQWQPKPLMVEKWEVWKVSDSRNMTPSP